MELPNIRINGEKIQMKEPTARTWRKLMQMQKEDQDVSTFAAIVSTSYGITEDEALDMPISDLMPAALNAVNAVNELVNEKLSNLVPGKNAPADEARS